MELRVVVAPALHIWAVQAGAQEDVQAGFGAHAQVARVAWKGGVGEGAGSRGWWEQATGTVQEGAALERNFCLCGLNQSCAAAGCPPWKLCSLARRAPSLSSSCCCSPSPLLPSAPGCSAACSAPAAQGAAMGRE